MLLYPFEEQFNLPAVLVKLRNLLSWQLEVVGDENESFVCVLIIVSYSTQWLGVLFCRIEVVEGNCLITKYTLLLSDLSR